ncbi:hypothetical protein C0J52_23140 [Blattella germanica]|nr:hypothetical protein C0J52_23140 [Blattella germanica]
MGSAATGRGVVIDISIQIPVVTNFVLIYSNISVIAYNRILHFLVYAENLTTESKKHGTTIPEELHVSGKDGHEPTEEITSGKEEFTFLTKVSEPKSELTMPTLKNEENGLSTGTANIIIPENYDFTSNPKFENGISRTTSIPGNLS